MKSRSLRSVLLGMPLLSLMALGLGVSVEVGCARIDTDDGFQEDQGAFTGGHGYGYGSSGYGSYRRGSYVP